MDFRKKFKFIIQFLLFILIFFLHTSSTSSTVNNFLMHARRFLRLLHFIYLIKISISSTASFTCHLANIYVSGSSIFLHSFFLYVQLYVQCPTNEAYPFSFLYIHYLLVQLVHSVCYFNTANNVSHIEYQRAHSHSVHHTFIRLPEYPWYNSVGTKIVLWIASIALSEIFGLPMTIMSVNTITSIYSPFNIYFIFTNHSENTTQIYTFIHLF